MHKLLKGEVARRPGLACILATGYTTGVWWPGGGVVGGRAPAERARGEGRKNGCTAYYCRSENWRCRDRLCRQRENEQRCSTRNFSQNEQEVWWPRSVVGSRQWSTSAAPASTEYLRCRRCHGPRRVTLPYAPQSQKSLIHHSPVLLHGSPLGNARSGLSSLEAPSLRESDATTKRNAALISRSR